MGSAHDTKASNETAMVTCHLRTALTLVGLW